MIGPLPPRNRQPLTPLRYSLHALIPTGQARKHRRKGSTRMNQLAEFIDRYVSVWNEQDPDARRRSIATLWAPDGATCYSQLDARGYEAIEARVASANEKWVRNQSFVFRPRKSIAAHHNVVKLVWEMVPASGGGGRDWPERADPRPGRPHPRRLSVQRAARAGLRQTYRVRGPLCGVLERAGREPPSPAAGRALGGERDLPQRDVGAGGPCGHRGGSRQDLRGVRRQGPRLPLDQRRGGPPRRSQDELGDAPARRGRRGGPGFRAPGPGWRGPHPRRLPVHAMSNLRPPISAIATSRKSPSVDVARE